MQKSILETKEQNTWGQEIELKVHSNYKISKSKDKKACVFVNLLDRSSSLVWMTHSHCVRRNPAKVVGSNPIRSTPTFSKADPENFH